MRIDALRVLVVGNAWKNWVIVALDTDDGLTGYGEATLGVSTLPVIGALDELRPLVVGEDPIAVDALWERMSRAWYLPGDPVHRAAMSAVEIGCWDLIGKSLGKPIHMLLGGPARERIPVYANGWYPAERSPDAYAERAAATVANGYRALKFDPFGAAGGGLPAAEERLARSIVAAVRDVVGADVELMIEAHDRFDVRTARAIARWLEPYDITWLEAPVYSEDIEQLRQAAKGSPVPIAAGERLTQPFQFDALGRRGGIGIWQPETLAVGGVSGVRRIASLAVAQGAVLAPHNARGPVCTAVNVELAAWLPGLLFLETFVSDAVPLAREIAPDLPVVENGTVRPTGRPGIGIAIDEDAARAHPFDRNHVLRLFEAGWESRRGVLRPGRRRCPRVGSRRTRRHTEAEEKRDDRAKRNPIGPDASTACGWVRGIGCGEPCRGHAGSVPRVDTRDAGAGVAGGVPSGDRVHAVRGTRGEHVGGRAGDDPLADPQPERDGRLGAGRRGLGDPVRSRASRHHDRA